MERFEFADGSYYDFEKWNVPLGIKMYDEYRNRAVYYPSLRDKETFNHCYLYVTRMFNEGYTDLTKKCATAARMIPETNTPGKVNSRIVGVGLIMPGNTMHGLEGGIYIPLEMRWMVLYRGQNPQSILFFDSVNIVGKLIYEKNLMTNGAFEKITKKKKADA